VLKVTAILGLFIAGTLSAQVVFSRRVYKEQGRSYQQIWMWYPADGVLKALTSSARNHYFPECKDGAITFVSPEPWRDDSKLWSLDRRSREEREIGTAPKDIEAPHTVSGCDAYARLGDLRACGLKEDLTVSRAGKRIGAFHIQPGGCAGPCETPIEGLKWSPDAKWLVVTALGVNTNSTAPQSDYYVVNIAAMKLEKAASAFEAVWLPGLDQLMYTTPRDTAPLPGTAKERDVWVQHLKLFDPATGKTAVITTGVTNNLNPAWCGR
jgi:hypothetical protein